MKVLGIVCSPRLNGNTEILIRESLAGAQESGAEVELLTLSGKTIAPCDACYSCRKTGKCHIKDDMQGIYTKLLEADGIIFGTPVFFWTVCAQAKALIDRCFVFMEGRQLRRKAAGVVVTTRRVGATSAYTVFANFFNLQRMMLVGGAVGFSGVEVKVKDDKRGMEDAKALGRAIVRHIQSQKIPAQ